MSKYTQVGATAVLTVSADGTDSAPLNPNAKALRIVGDDLAAGKVFLKFVQAEFDYASNTVIALNSNSYGATTQDFVVPEMDTIGGYAEVVELSGQAYVYALGGVGASDTLIYVTELM